MIEEKLKWWKFYPELESVDEFRDRCLMNMPDLSPAEMDVLKQCATCTWDGNILSKTARNKLAEKGLLTRCSGWQVVTDKGIKILDLLGIIRA